MESLVFFKRAWIISALLLATAVSAGPAGAQGPRFNFTAPIHLDPGQQAFQLVVRDFNRDGNLDVVTATGAAFDGNGTNRLKLIVFLGNGDGTFQLRREFDYSGLTGASATGFHPAAADFNSDGFLDVALGHGGTTVLPGGFGNKVTIHLGDGAGNFAPFSVFSTGGSGIPLLAADFNEDGRVDLLAATGDDRTVRLHLGNGDGTFPSGGIVIPNTGPGMSAGMVGGDFNHDGHADVAGTGHTAEVVVALGHGDGSFTVQRVPLPRFNRALSEGDLNGDGNLDLVAGGFQDLFVLLGNGDGTFQAPRIFFVALKELYQPAIADFNGDGNNDVAVAFYRHIENVETRVSILPGDGHGNLGPLENFDLGLTPVTMAAADFNADGRVDLVTATESAGALIALLNAETPTGPVRTEESYRLRAYIDGRSLFVLRRNAAQWHHLDAAAPGRWLCQNLPTIINGVSWIPLWDNVPTCENRRFGALSSVFTDLMPPIPRETVRVRLDVIQARHRVTVAEYPTAVNDFAIVIDFDDNPVGGAEWYEIILHVEVPNDPPVARAGEDQTVECASHSGTAVTLDGSASSDPDGDTLSYEWRDANGNVVAAEAVAHLTLPLGPHIFTLTVNDGHGGAASDDVMIIVQDTTPPTLTLAADSVMVVVPTASADGAMVDVLGASGHGDLCDPHPTITHNGPADGFFPIGTTVVTITATDDTGNVAQQQLTVNIVYNFIGFLRPINNDGSSIFKSGRVIPVKFQLAAADGTFITNATATLHVFKVTDEVLGSVEVTSVGEANEDNFFRLDVEMNTYIYNLSTRGYTTGTYLLRVALNDSTLHDVLVSVR